MEKMLVYESLRTPPKEACKTITAGRLKGMTDINPMWRIKALTEQFGMCGIGWYYTTDRQWTEEIGDEVVACVNISLYVKYQDEWSKSIFGTGGAKLATMERNGKYVSDEAFKMATTDAISVACKQLGMAADVYWQNDRSKYSNAQPQPEKEDAVKEAEIKAKVLSYFTRHNFDNEKLDAVAKHFNVKNVKELTGKQCLEYIESLKKKGVGIDE